MAPPRQPPRHRSSLGEAHTAIQMGRTRHKAAKQRAEKPRQEICAPLKWTCFMINFFIFLASVGCLALGVYLFLNDPRPIGESADVLLNPAVLLACVGLCSGLVALLGLFGALRDNVCLLKLFALLVFLGYLCLVVCTCLLFLLFYSDATGDDRGISARALLLHSIRRYHTNRNVADFVDYLQEQLECCGSTSFRDWQLSDQFQCNASNPYPERCGVPFSCCRRSVVSEAGAGANGGQNPLSPAIRSLQCWQNAQKKREQQLDSDIYVGGCLQPLRALFDEHALHIGLGVVSVILPVCIGVFLSQCLARQIDYQNFLLRREQRRIERRERKERRYLEQQGATPSRARNPSNNNATLEGPAAAVNPLPLGERRPPRCPPPPTPRNDAEAAALAAALKASKREWEREERRRRKQQHGGRAASSSPLRAVVVKGGANNRVSTTLEMEPRERRKRDGDGKEKHKGRRRHRSGTQQQPGGGQPNGATARPEPSAPPRMAVLTLHQSHFQ